MMENENNYTQFAGRRGGPSEQDVQASGRNAARPGGDAAPAAESQRNDAPRGGFALYTGSGVCDVCNAPLSGRKAYIVPNDVFYNSPKYREHYRQFQRNLTGMNIPDSAFAQIRAMDHSSGSAVCENCIHMFETPLSARPIGGYVPAPSPAAFPQAQGRFGGIPQSAAGQPVSGAQKQNAGGSQKKKLPKFVLPAAIAAAVIIVAVFGIVMLTREPAVDTEQLLKSGLAYLDDEHYFEALEQFRTVIDADPEAAEAPYIGAADAYIGLNRPDRAVRILEKGYKNTNSGIIQRRLDELAETLSAATSADGYGNTNGNISNDALAAVQGEWVFYIADGALYKAKADGSEETRLAGDAYRVNVAGDWIYFVKNDNIYKIKTDGTEETLVSEDFVRSYPIAVAGDWIYYGTSQAYENYGEQMSAEAISMAMGEYGIYKIRTDGSERTQVTPSVCHGLNVEGAWLYYLGIDDSIWKIRTDGGEETQLLDEPCRALNVSGDWIYYVNLADNGIYRMRTDGSENAHITGDDTHSLYTNYLNVSGDWLYYTNFDFADAVISDDTGLYKMRSDGSEKTQLTNDRAIIPNIAGEWIYYLSFDDEYGLNFNKVRTDGTDGRILN